MSQVESLTFDTLRVANLRRAQESYRCGDWSLNDWMTALAGEVGELANVLKKVRRGDFTLEQVRPGVAAELADIQTYLDILAAKVGIDLGDATCKKWNEVSLRVGSPLRISRVGMTETTS